MSSSSLDIPGSNPCRTTDYAGLVVFWFFFSFFFQIQTGLNVASTMTLHDTCLSLFFVV